MKIWLNAMLGGAVIAALTVSAPGLARGGGGPSAVHGGHSFGAAPFRFAYSPFRFAYSPFRFAYRPFRFGPAFRQARFAAPVAAGWGGGAYSGGVVGFDDQGLDDMYFRVQEPFGPGDLGRARGPEGPGDSGPWNAQAPPPWRGDDSGRW